ncbi:MAG: hypothetical protein JSS91_05625 [Bacteroidetes bacterium]|nr:hypothetical protein [Bacteroidota bacterium]
MKNTKLIKVLKTFSRSEALKFREFVLSPFYNKNRSVMKLCEEVLRFHPDYNTDELSDENIFRKVFGNEKYEYFKIKNIISDLYQLSEMFLKTSAFLKKDLENEIDLLNELHERNLDTLYIQKEKQLRKKLDAAVRDEIFFYAKYLHAKLNTSHFKFEKTGYLFGQIQNEFDTLFDFSLTSLLKLYAKMLHNKNHGNVNFDMKMFDSVRDYIKDRQFEDNPSVQIYRQSINLELSKDEKDYRTLLDLKKKFADRLSDEDIYYILLVTNSYSVYRLKLGDVSYYKDRFKSLAEILERKFIPDNNFLFVNFISTFTSACMAGETDWAVNFLESHQNSISPQEENHNTVNYCRGFLAYRLNDYESALDYFSRTNFRLFLMKVMVKSYTLRIYYEQDMHEQTLSAIDAFRHYLKSEDQIADEQKIAHYEFLKFISELTRLKLDGVKKNNDSRLVILRKEINKMHSNPLGSKNWLIEKSENFL